MGSEGQLLKPARGRKGKTPVISQKGNPLLSAGGARGLERGQVEPPAPPGLQPSSNESVPSRQSKLPAQPGHSVGRQRSAAQTEGRQCGFPLSTTAGGGGGGVEGPLAGVYGRGHPAPRHSLPLHRQHQRVTARHCHHREGHMGVSACGTGRE